MFHRWICWLYLYSHWMENCKYRERYVWDIFLDQSIAINFLESPFGVKFRKLEFFLTGVFRGEQRGEEFRKFVFSSILYPNFRARTTLHTEALKFWILESWVPQCSSILNSSIEFSNLPISQFPTSQNLFLILAKYSKPFSKISTAAAAVANEISTVKFRLLNILK